MRTRWQGAAASILITAVATGMVVLDLTDVRFRRWWNGRALTTDAVAGALVVLLTVLVVDQIVARRQEKDRARAVAAQAAIVRGQAIRSAKAVSAALAGSGERDAAAEEIRTYMIMLLVGSPLLIEARVSRNFLEKAQRLAGELVRALAVGGSTATEVSSAQLDAAIEQIQAASIPLFQALNAEEQVAAGGVGPP
jgi:hypothetical protein